MAIEADNIKDGDYVGLSAFQNRYGFVGNKMEDGKKYIVMHHKAYFYYSYDNENWYQIGDELQMAYDWPHFVGYSIKNNKLCMKKGSKTTLKAVNISSDAVDVKSDNITYESSNKKVAVVSKKGTSVVLGVKKITNGKTVISATCGKKKALK